MVLLLRRSSATDSSRFYLFQSFGINVRERLPKRLFAFAAIATEEIAKFFNHVMPNHEVGCCIRIANAIPCEKGEGRETYYATLARSENIDELRATDSEWIYSYEGIALALIQKIEKKECSLFLVRHISKLADQEEKKPRENRIWVRTKNDSIKGIQSSLICPVNIRETEGMVMLGILYITSREKGWRCPFSSEQVESLSAIADFLACLLEQFVTRRRKKKNGTKKPIT